MRLLPDEERVDLTRGTSPRRVGHFAQSRALVALESCSIIRRWQEIVIDLGNTSRKKIEMIPAGELHQMPKCLFELGPGLVCERGERPGQYSDMRWIELTWNFPYQPELTRPDSCGGKEDAELTASKYWERIMRLCSSVASAESVEVKSTKAPEVQ